MALLETMALAGRDHASEGELERQLNDVMDRAVLTYLKLYGLEQGAEMLFGGSPGGDSIDPFDIMGKVASTGAESVIGKILRIRGLV